MSTNYQLLAVSVQDELWPWAGRTAYMVVAQDYVTRRKGVEVLRQQIINRLETEVKEEYCAKLYRFMLCRRLCIVVEEEYIKNIRDLCYS